MSVYIWSAVVILMGLGIGFLVLGFRRKPPPGASKDRGSIAPMRPDRPQRMRGNCKTVVAPGRGQLAVGRILAPDSAFSPFLR